MLNNNQKPVTNQPSNVYDTAFTTAINEISVQGWKITSIPDNVKDTCARRLLDKMPEDIVKDLFLKLVSNPELLATVSMNFGAPIVQAQTPLKISQQLLPAVTPTSAHHLAQNILSNAPKEPEENTNLSVAELTTKIFNHLESNNSKPEPQPVSEIENKLKSYLDNLQNNSSNNNNSNTQNQSNLAPISEATSQSPSRTSLNASEKADEIGKENDLANQLQKMLNECIPKSQPTAPVALPVVNKTSDFSQILKLLNPATTTEETSIDDKIKSFLTQKPNKISFAQPSKPSPVNKKIAGFAPHLSSNLHGLTNTSTGAPIDFDIQIKTVLNPANLNQPSNFEPALKLAQNQQNTPPKTSKAASLAAAVGFPTSHSTPVSANPRVPDNSNQNNILSNLLNELKNQQNSGGNSPNALLDMINQMSQQQQQSKLIKKPTLPVPTGLEEFFNQPNSTSINQISLPTQPSKTPSTSQSPALSTPTPFFCEKCEKYFKNNAGFKMHIRSHKMKEIKQVNGGVLTASEATLASTLASKMAAKWVNNQAKSDNGIMRFTGFEDGGNEDFQSLIQNAAQGLLSPSNNQDKSSNSSPMPAPIKIEAQEPAQQLKNPTIDIANILNSNWSKNSVEPKITLPEPKTEIASTKEQTTSVSPNETIQNLIQTLTKQSSNNNSAVASPRSVPLPVVSSPAQTIRTETGASTPKSQLSGSTINNLILPLPEAPTGQSKKEKKQAKSNMPPIGTLPGLTPANNQHGPSDIPEDTIVYITDPDGEKKHLCTICNYTSKRYADLRDHQRIHSDERPFKCNMCDSKFKQRQTLRNHKRNVHKIVPDKPRGSAAKMEASKAANNQIMMNVDISNLAPGMDSTSFFDSICSGAIAKAQQASEPEQNSQNQVENQVQNQNQAQSLTDLLASLGGNNSQNNQPSKSNNSSSNSKNDTTKDSDFISDLYSCKSISPSDNSNKNSDDYNNVTPPMKKRKISEEVPSQAPDQNQNQQASQSHQTLNSSLDMTPLSLSNIFNSNNQNGNVPNINETLANLLGMQGDN